jgi:hypothetical protein
VFPFLSQTGLSPAALLVLPPLQCQYFPCPANIEQEKNKKRESPWKEIKHHRKKKKKRASKHTVPG